MPSMQGSPCGYSDLKCSGSTPGEPPTTASGRSFVGGEFKRKGALPRAVRESRDYGSAVRVRNRALIEIADNTSHATAVKTVSRFW